jgi:hypothetical protein
MMKWIVGILLLANVALFGWMRWGSVLTTDKDAVQAQAALNADKVALLEYLPVSAAASAPSVTAGASLPMVAAPAPVATVQPPAPSGTKTPVTAASAPQHIPLVPLPQSAPVAPPVAPPPEPAKVVPSRQASCAEWGEFSGNDLARAQESLAMLKLGGDLSQRTVEQDHGYWVYIPPQKKRSEVEKKIAQLKERGVKDYFVVQEKGKWMNTISLGIFKSEAAAQKYLATLRTKGVRTAKIGERKSKLRYTVFLVKALDSGTEDKLNALQKDFPGSELKVLACED